MPPLLGKQLWGLRATNLVSSAPVFPGGRELTPPFSGLVRSVQRAAREPLVVCHAMGFTLHGVRNVSVAPRKCGKAAERRLAVRCVCLFLLLVGSSRNESVGEMPREFGSAYVEGRALSLWFLRSCA